MAKIGGLLERLRRAAERREALTVEQLLESIGARAFGPLLLIPGLLMLTPLAGVPTVPSAMAAFVVLVGSQLLAGKKSPWLPKWLGSRRVESQRLLQAIDFLKPAARWLDRIFRPRWKLMVSKPARFLAGCLAVLLALSVPPLELVPMAALIPGFAIALLGIALTTRDGLLMTLSLLSVTVGSGVALSNL